MEILQILAELGINFKKVTRNEYSSPCPACGGEDRFRTWPHGSERNRRNVYFCRQCRKSGDLIQALMDFKSLSFNEAKIRAAESQPEGGYVDYGHNDIIWEPKPKELKQTDEWKELAVGKVENGYWELMQNDSQIEYLRKRGISKDTISMFKLGYAPNNTFETVSVIENDSEKKRKLVFPGGIIIPYFDNSGLHRIRIRNDNGFKGGRFHVVHGSGNDCFIAGSFESKNCVVVESELDAILLEQEVGDVMTIIAAGSATNRPCSTAHAILSKASKILVALDFDEPGKAGAKWWLRQYKNSRFYPSAKGKDPTEDYQAGVNLNEWIARGIFG